MLFYPFPRHLLLYKFCYLFSVEIFIYAIEKCIMINDQPWYHGISPLIKVMKLMT